MLVSVVVDSLVALIGEALLKSTFWAKPEDFERPLSEGANLYRVRCQHRSAQKRAMTGRPKDLLNCNGPRFFFGRSFAFGVGRAPQVAELMVSSARDRAASATHGPTGGGHL